MKETGFDFYLAPGGPVDRLQGMLKMRRDDDAHLGLRALITALVIWLPLAVLAFLEPNPGMDVPFTHDIAAHVRFLLVVPLLILAEGTIGRRSRMVVAQFLSSGLVPDSEAGRFESAARRGRRLIDSWIAEIIIIAVSALLVSMAVHGVLAEPALFWFEKVSSQGNVLTRAGWWYAAVATPVFVFLLLRWFWRYLIWWWFLGRVARLDLRLTGAHPDRTGGLGFVSFHHSMFASLTFAVACAVSAAAANRILWADATLQSYKIPLVLITIGAVLCGVAPLLVFTAQLIRAKRRNWMSYSRFASDYVWMFEQKWMGKKTPDEEALGSGDIQSLADLGAGFERMIEMRPTAIDRRLLLSFLVAAVAPLLPLTLTVMPLRDILKMMLKAMM
jgi:hypothetical protein